MSKSKELLKACTACMSRMEKGEAKIDEVNAMANIAKQALGALAYEISRAKALADPAVRKQFRDIEQD